jgi:hypothetical protein
MSATLTPKSPASPAAEAPYPGSHSMPRWTVAELPDAPLFQWKNAWQFLGPGLLMGGAAIGGGEWLLGPRVTALYGGGLFWLSTLSILGQVVYNIEISRYTLYTGEPIFTGKFRTLPGPMFWVSLYVLLDAGSLFSYQAASAATPLLTMYFREVPTADQHYWALKITSLCILTIAFIPLIIGGKIYNSLKLVMTAKIAILMGFLLILAVFYSDRSTWIEIFSGFFKFGQVPTGKGNELDNVFLALYEGRALPNVDLKMAAYLSGLVAISGQGGLSNTPVSNYTRDQGWGMGAHVGAIPSIVGGHNIQLSHVGAVFPVDEKSLPRWKQWYRHIARDQLMVWMPACFFGLALPSMLSVQFLPRGTEVKNPWAASVMTAGGVQEAVGGNLGEVFWFMTLFCGVLVLGTSVASTIDGVVRRWVDVLWTASKRLHRLEPSKIKYVYFSVLSGLFVLTFIMLIVVDNADVLLKIATTIFNFALGFSCWHVAVLNSILLPKPLRPCWTIRILLVLTGLFFWGVGTIGAIEQLRG